MLQKYRLDGTKIGDFGVHYENVLFHTPEKLKIPKMFSVDNDGNILILDANLGSKKLVSCIEHPAEKLQKVCHQCHLDPRTSFLYSLSKQPKSTPSKYRQTRQTGQTSAMRAFMRTVTPLYDLTTNISMAVTMREITPQI